MTFVSDSVVPVAAATPILDSIPNYYPILENNNVSEKAAIAAICSHLDFNNGLILNYDNLDFITNTLMLDNSGPTLDYDMSRYVDETFINSRFFFKNSYFQFSTYNDFLSAFVELYGKKIDNELYGYWESHNLFLFSCLKKIYVLQYTDFQLDKIDFYVLDWAKHNLSIEEIAEYRDLVINNPVNFKIIHFKL